MDIGSLTGQVAIEDQVTDKLIEVATHIKQWATEVEGEFGAAAIGVGVLTAAIVGMAISIVELGKAGSDVNDVAGTFEHFADKVGNAEDTLEKMREGVKNTVTDFDLMKDSSRLMAANVKLSADQFGELTQAAFVLQNRGLGSTKQMLDLVTDAMITGRTRSLALKLGVVDVKDSTEEFAKSLGVEVNQLTAAGAAEGKRLGIMKMLEAANKEAGFQTRDFGEQIEFAETQLANWKEELESAVAKSPHLAAALDAIGASFNELFGGTGKGLIDGIVMAIDAFADGVAKAARFTVTFVHGIQDFVQLLKDYKVAIEAVVAAWAAYTIIVPLATNLTKLYETAAIAARIATMDWSSAFKVVQVAFQVGIGIIQGMVSELWVIIAANPLVALAGAIGLVVTAVAAWEERQAALNLRLEEKGAGEDRVRLAKSYGAAVSTQAEAVAFLDKRYRDLRGAALELDDALKELRSNTGNVGEQLRDLEKTVISLSVSDDPLKQLTTPKVNQIAAAIKAMGVNAKDLPPALAAIAASAANLAKLNAGDFVKDADPKKLAAANEAAESKTENLWAQYYQVLEKMEGDSLGAQLASIDRWVDAQVASLEKSKADAKHYWEEFAAISSTANAKRIAAQIAAEKPLTDAVLKAEEDRLQEAYDLDVAAAARKEALQKTIDAGFISAQKTLVDEQNKLTMTQRDYQASQLMTQLDDARDNLIELGEGYRATYDKIKETTRLKLSEIGVEWDDSIHEWVHNFDFMWSKGGVEHSMLPPNAVKNAKSGLAELTGALGGLGNEIVQISQISQGSFSNVVKYIGLAVKAAESFGKALEATQGLKASGVPAAGQANVSGAVGGVGIAGGGLGAAAATTSTLALVTAWIGVGIAVYSFISALREAQKESEKLQLVAIAAMHAVKDLAASTNFSDALNQQLSDTTVDFEHITALNTKFTTSLERLQQQADSAGMSVEDLAKQLGISATVFMSDLAEAAHLSDILKELGGVSALTADQLKVVQTRARDLFILAALGGPTGQAAIKTLDDTLIQFTTNLVKSGGIVDQYFLDMAKQAKDAGIALQQVAAFQAQQAQNAETGILGALQITNDAYDARKDLQSQLADLQGQLATESGDEAAKTQASIDAVNAKLLTQQQIIDATGAHSQAAAGAMAGALLGFISEQEKAGVSFGDAVRAAAPGIESLKKRLDEMQGGGGDAFDFLNQQVALFTGEVTGPALASIEDYATALVGMQNAGMGTQETFSGLTEQIGKTARALVGQGVDGHALLIAMQTPLQQIWELEQKFGYQADDATQSLINEAVATGEVGEAHKTVSEQMLDANNRIADSVEYLATVFGYVAPAAETAAKGVNAALSTIKTPNITIPIDWKPNPNIDFPLPSPDDVDQAKPHSAGGKIYSFSPVGADRVPAMLAEGEGVVTVSGMRNIGEGGLARVNAGDGMWPAAPDKAPAVVVTSPQNEEIAKTLARLANAVMGSPVPVFVQITTNSDDPVPKLVAALREHGELYDAIQMAARNA